MYDDAKNGLSDNSTIYWQETNLGESWRCEVTPNDGFGDGPTLSSESMIILSSENTPPVAENLTLTPDVPFTTDDLVASYDYFDADGDLEWGSEIFWFNGVPQ